MIKTKKIVKKIEKEIIEEATCSFCGKKFDKITTECSGFGTINFSFGYGSIFDDEHFHLEICDDCFLKRFSNLLKPQLKKKGLWNIK